MLSTETTRSMASSRRACRASGVELAEALVAFVRTRLQLQTVPAHWTYLDQPSDVAELY